MTTDPASILPAIACDDCGVTAGLCVYTSGPNAGKPRATRYGPHKCRVDDSVTAARWYDRGVSAGAASRQPDVDAARSRAESAERALGATKTQLDKALADLAACQAEREPEPDTDPKWAEALDMTSNALQLTAGVGANDYWLKFIDPHGENDKHLTGGGFVRDRPIGAPTTPVPAGGWPARMLDNARTEIKMAKKAGLDGLQGCLLTPPGVSPVDNWNRAVAMSKAAAEDGAFRYTPLIDCTASFANRTAAAVAADLKTLYAYGAARRIDGELVLSSFKAEAKPLTWWTDLLGLLEADLGPIKFIADFLNPPANLKPWADIAHALGVWGPASPNGVPGLATFAKNVKAAGVKVMLPVRPLADVRPYEDRWFEGNGSQLSRDMWERARAGADYVLVATWDDEGESTALWPSVNHGTALCEINAYYAEWFRTGKQSAITQDKVYLFHRTQPFAAKAAMAGVHQANLDKASVPGRDAVEALVFATAPADLAICGIAATVPAGISWPTVPLKVGPAGSVAATLTRAGTTVASVVSPFAVTDKPLVPDHTYRVVAVE